MSYRTGTPSGLGNGRAQSEIVGLVLVFGLVILGATAVVVLGSSALGDSQETLSTQRAEKTLTQLDSKAALVALGNTDVQSVSFSTRDAGQFTVTNGTGWMNLTIENTTSGKIEHEFEQRLGTVRYDNAPDTVAYQGGGVWRTTGNGSVMVSPPEFHFRNGTLTVPIINVTGQRSINGGAVLTHAETIDKYPIQPDRVNPLDEHRIFVEVRSDYYQAWGRYFERRTDGVVVYEHDKNKARLELVSPLGKQTLNAASSSRSASGEFLLTGASKTACSPVEIYTNSYNSSGTTVDYCNQTTGDEGHVIYGRDIDLSLGTGGHDLRGNIVSGGSVNVTNSQGTGQPEIYGHINYTDDCLPSVSECQSRIKSGDTTNEIGGIETMHSINLLIKTKVDEIRSDSDNGPAPVDSNDRLNFSANTPSDEVTLTAGKYYLSEVTVDDGEKLILNTSGGDVILAVDGDINLHGKGGGLGSGGVIEIQGDGAGKIYMNGSNVVMEKNSAIVPGGVSGQENATQFRLYGRDDLQIQVGDGSSSLAKFVGVVFAPPGRSGTGRVDLDGGEVYGGILTGTTTIDEGSIHYDEALANTQIISRDEKTVRVTYLHVTVNRIYVTNR